MSFSRMKREKTVGFVSWFRRRPSSEGKLIFQPDFGFVVTGQRFLGALEFGGMDSPASVCALRDSKVKVQQFVKERAGDDNIGNTGIIQCAIESNNPPLDIAKAKDNAPAIS